MPPEPADGDTPEPVNPVERDLVNLRTRQFQRIIDEEPPVLLDEFGLDDVVRDQLYDYVGRMQEWLAGELAWYRGDPPPHPATGRDTVPHRPPHRSLGTSAVHLARAFTGSQAEEFRLFASGLGTL